MAIEPITTSGPSITVSNAEEFLDAYRALSNEEGGGSILLKSGAEPFKIKMYHPYTGGLGEEPVVVKSSDRDEPADLSRIFLRNVSNIRFENVHIDATFQDGNNLTIQGSDNIQIVDSHFVGDATGPAMTASDKSESLGNIRESSDILFSNNTVENLFSALGVTNSDNVEISGNTFEHLQGDGLQLGGVQNIRIVDNHFSDFFSSPNSVIHPDMIQFHGSGINQATVDVTISGNFFDNGEGGATQTIFMRNEKIRTDVTDDHKNITISDNLIYNGSLNGISLADIDGLTLTDNTLLWNPEATVVGSDGSTQAPRIILRNSVTNILAEGNIAASMAIPEGADASDNHLLNYSDPDSPNYVGTHFVNAANGGDLDLKDLRLLPESEWVGTGAPMSQPVTTTDDGVDAVLRYSVEGSDIYELTFDAKLSIDTEGYLSESDYDFAWKFDDGVTMDGISVTREFPDSGEYGATLSVFKGGELQDEVSRAVVVESKDIFELDFEGGVVDLSDIDAKLVTNGDDALVDGYDGKGFRLDGDDNGFYVHRETGEINDLKAFGLSLDLRLDDADGAGNFLNFYTVMKGGITDDGAIRFSMNTDEGSFSLSTEPGVMGVGEWHRVGIAYDDDAGNLGLYVDGELAAETAASGETAARQHNMTFGEVFGRSSAKVTLDNVVMSKDPEVAGELTVRKDPSDPESEAPSDPVPDEPTDPVAEQPSDPVAEEPSDPVAEQPTDPVAEQPSDPVADTPSDPVADAPSEPEPEPDEPVDAGAPAAPDSPVTRDGGRAPEPDAGAPSTPDADDADGEDTEPDGAGEQGRPVSQVREETQAFFSKIINMIMNIFGLGSTSEEEEVAEDTTPATGEARSVTSLLDLVPVIGSYADDLPDDDEEDDLDLAA